MWTHLIHEYTVVVRVWLVSAVDDNTAVYFTEILQEIQELSPAFLRSTPLDLKDNVRHPQAW